MEKPGKNHEIVATERRKTRLGEQVVFTIVDRDGGQERVAVNIGSLDLPSPTAAPESKKE